jgi:hypothetical protein
MPAPKRISQAVADALMQVSSFPQYRNKWIAAHDWAKIIRHEYYIPDSLVLNDAVINKAVRNDPRYRMAAEVIGNYTGTFRDKYKPQVLPDGSRNTKEIYCYYVTDEGGYPPKPPPGYRWYDYVESVVLSSDRICGVTEDHGNEFLAKFLDTDCNVVTSFPVTPKPDGQPPPTTSIADDAKVSSVTPLTPRQNLKRSHSESESTDMMSPRNECLTKIAPRKSQKVVLLRSESVSVAWNSGSNNPVDDRTTRRNVEKLEPLLMGLVDQDPNAGAEMLYKCLNRSDRVTNEKLRAYLRDRGARLTGLKHELAAELWNAILLGTMKAWDLWQWTTTSMMVTTWMTMVIARMRNNLLVTYSYL